MERDLERMFKEALDKGAFNQNLLNSQINLKEP